MTKDEALKILASKAGNDWYGIGNDKVYEAMEHAENNGYVIEAWAAFYKGQNWTLMGAIASTPDPEFGTIFLIPTEVADGSEDNERLADLIFYEIDKTHNDIDCGAQMEYTFEAYGDGLTEEKIKQYVNDICEKYGFKFQWEDIEDHPEWQYAIED